MNRAIKEMCCEMFRLSVAVAVFGCAASVFAYQQNKPAVAEKSAALPSSSIAAAADGKRGNAYLALHLDMIGSPLQGYMADSPAAQTGTNATANCRARAATEALLHHENDATE